MTGAVRKVLGYSTIYGKVWVQFQIRQLPDDMDLVSLMHRPRLREMSYSHNFDAFKAPSGCPERSRLFTEFKSIHHRLMQIHDANMRAVLVDDFTALEQLRVELVELRKRRDKAAKALQFHLKEHGCIR